MTSPKAAAKEIMGMMQYLFQGPDEIASAIESDFPHIDFSKYKDLEATLSKEGFKKISDVELVNISNDPTAVYNKTLIRSFSSHDGNLVVSCYELRPKWSRLVILLIRGLLAFRLIDAPLFFIGMIPARFILDIESQFCDNTFIVTSNAATAGFLKGPPTIDEQHLPFNTSLEQLMSAHLARVTIKTENGIKASPVLSDKDLFEMQKNLKLEKSAHRSSCDWITKEEIDMMCQGNFDVSEIVYKELRILIDEHKKHNNSNG